MLRKWLLGGWSTGNILSRKFSNPSQIKVKSLLQSQSSCQLSARAHQLSKAERWPSGAASPRQLES